MSDGVMSDQYHTEDAVLAAAMRALLRRASWVSVDETPAGELRLTIDGHAVVSEEVGAAVAAVRVATVE